MLGCHARLPGASAIMAKRFHYVEINSMPLPRVCQPGGTSWSVPIVQDARVAVEANIEASQRQVGQQVRALRVERGLTLEDLAARSGCSIGSLSQIERGL